VPGEPRQFPFASNRCGFLSHGRSGKGFLQPGPSAPVAPDGQDFHDRGGQFPRQAPHLPVEPRFHHSRQDRKGRKARLRTPVKDPAEIGFLLLLIASSIGASSGNFMITGLLFAATFLVLGVKWLLRDRTAIGARGSLMLSLDQADFEKLEGRIKEFLGARLRSLKLDSMSVVDNRVNLQYQYSRQPELDWTTFANELNRTAAPATIEIFVG